MVNVSDFKVHISYVYQGTDYEYNATITADTSDDAMREGLDQAVFVDKPENLEVWAIPVHTP